MWADPKPWRVLVVPAASGHPNWLFSYLKRLLRTRGTPENNVELAHIAMVDDESTAYLDESSWIRGAYEPSELAKLDRANVVWFSGGDQKRHVALLRNEQGQDSPFQTAVLARLAEGSLIVAGTSAGAAVMTDPMIVGGSSWGALTLPADSTCTSSEALCIGLGLGYLPSSYGVVTDQHFFRRGRFGRLVRALAMTDQRVGIGVGDVSGFYVDLQRKSAEVVGTPGQSFVAIVGRSGAAENREDTGPPFLGDGYTFSVLAVGDTYQFPDATRPRSEGGPLEPNNAYAPFSMQFGNPPVFTDAFGSETLLYHVTSFLADGTPQTTGARVDTVSLAVTESGSVTGFLFRFTADNETRVAYNDATGYSIFNVRLKIGLVSAKLGGLEP